jgi:2-hydroxychromene-2-carboxylate isomerase
MDARRVLARAASEATTKAYESATAEARSLGIFCVPTFVSCGEIFWGDDRLDDAVRWHRIRD